MRHQGEVAQFHLLSIVQKLIGVNRPAQRNAFDLAVIEALGAAYETLGTDLELRAGVLFGHGDHFSAGLDLAQVGPAVARDGHGALGSSHRFDPIPDSGRSSPRRARRPALEGGS